MLYCFEALKMPILMRSTSSQVDPEAIMATILISMSPILQTSRTFLIVLDSTYRRRFACTGFSRLNNTSALELKSPQREMQKTNQIIEAELGDFGRKVLSQPAVLLRCVPDGNLSLAVHQEGPARPDGHGTGTDGSGHDGERDESSLDAVAS